MGGVIEGLFLVKTKQEARKTQIELASWVG
jgi:hypothetical protein